MSIKALTTEVTDQDLSTIKQSLRVEEDSDNGLIRALILAARKDIIGQVGSKFDDFYDHDERFSVAVLMEVSHFYENRHAVSSAETYEVPMSLSYLINSMKDDYRLRLEEQNNGEESQPVPDEA